MREETDRICYPCVIVGSLVLAAMGFGLYRLGIWVIGLL